VSKTARPSDPAAALRATTRFAPSAVIECCYALAYVSDDEREETLHGPWTNAARHRLPAAFWRRFRELGGWSRIWTAVPDLLGEFAPAESMDQALARLAALPASEFVAELVGGVLHPRRIVRGLIKGEISLEKAVSETSSVHREWLLFSGLYPFDAGAPVARTLQQALDSPRRFRLSLVELLEEFWTTVFRGTWRLAQPAYERSATEKARLQAACDPQQLADELRLRVEIDLDKGFIAAVRGGYRLPLRQLRTAWMIPSAFNVHHFWHVLESDGKADALFPYFDPTLELGIVAPRTARRASASQFDPALVFRALADTARYSMVLLLGAAPRTATELGRLLSLSKGTVSHHVHILREAGVVSRALEGNAMMLSLDRTVLEQLSTETLRVIDRGGAVQTRRARKARR
jgi:ArsR family transcriptional regulator